MPESASAAEHYYINNNSNNTAWRMAFNKNWEGGEEMDRRTEKEQNWETDYKRDMLHQQTIVPHFVILRQTACFLTKTTSACSLPSPLLLLLLFLCGVPWNLLSTIEGCWLSQPLASTTKYSCSHGRPKHNHYSLRHRRGWERRGEERSMETRAAQREESKGNVRRERKWGNEQWKGCIAGKAQD